VIHSENPPSQSADILTQHMPCGNFSPVRNNYYFKEIKGKKNSAKHNSYNTILKTIEFFFFVFEFFRELMKLIFLNGTLIDNNVQWLSDTIGNLS
jgi:hypothetical protein